MLGRQGGETPTPGRKVPGFPAGLAEPTIVAAAAPDGPGVRADHAGGDDRP